VDELLASAERSLAQGNEEVAIRRYSEALALDGTCEPCFLGLGALREKRGDLKEAERVYSAALLRRADFPDVRIARARVRWRLERREDAVADLEEAAARTPRADVFRELVSKYRELRQVPAQLRAARQLLSFAEHAQDDALAQEARVLVTALVLVAGPTDPVAQPTTPDHVRRALARATR
jgi:tetratricopeptide (TPR) repeat protein